MAIAINEIVVGKNETEITSEHDFGSNKQIQNRTTFSESYRFKYEHLTEQCMRKHVALEHKPLACE